MDHDSPELAHLRVDPEAGAGLDARRLHGCHRAYLFSSPAPLGVRRSATPVARRRQERDSGDGTRLSWCHVRAVCRSRHPPRRRMGRTAGATVGSERVHPDRALRRGPQPGHARSPAAPRACFAGPGGRGRRRGRAPGAGAGIPVHRAVDPAGGFVHCGGADRVRGAAAGQGDADARDAPRRPGRGLPAARPRDGAAHRWRDRPGDARDATRRRRAGPVPRRRARARRHATPEQRAAGPPRRARRGRRVRDGRDDSRRRRGDLVVGPAPRPARPRPGRRPVVVRPPPVARRRRQLARGRRRLGDGRSWHRPSRAPLPRGVRAGVDRGRRVVVTAPDRQAAARVRVARRRGRARSTSATRPAGRSSTSWTRRGRMPGSPPRHGSSRCGTACCSATRTGRG